MECLLSLPFRRIFMRIWGDISHYLVLYRQVAINIYHNSWRINFYLGLFLIWQGSCSFRWDDCISSVAFQQKIRQSADYDSFWQCRWMYTPCDNDLFVIVFENLSDMLNKKVYTARNIIPQVWWKVPLASSTLQKILQNNYSNFLYTVSRLLPTAGSIPSVVYTLSRELNRDF